MCSNAHHSLTPLKNVTIEVYWRKDIEINEQSFSLLLLADATLHKFSFLIFSQSLRKARVLELINKVQEIRVELLELFHFAVVSDKFLLKSTDLRTYFLTEESLGGFNIFFGHFLKYFLKVGKLLCKFFEVFDIFMLSYAKNHIKCLFSIFFGYFKQFPKLISSKARRRTQKFYSPQVDDPLQ